MMIDLRRLFFFLWRILDGDDRHHLVLDLGHLGVHRANNLVDGSLVVLVEEGQGEEADPGEDDQGHHVEPGADVGEAPEAEDKLDGVEPVLEEEEAAELHDGGVGHVHQEPGDLGHLLWRDVHLQQKCLITNLIWGETNLNVSDGNKWVAAGVRLKMKDQELRLSFVCTIAHLWNISILGQLHLYLL